MSQLDPDVPPRGEDIHLPPGSVQPIRLTLGITIALIGVTTSTFATIGGLLLMVWVLALWIRDARREYAELPMDHGHH
jgi:hypothetical protein